MTDLQVRRNEAKAAEAGRTDAYHNGAETVVVGLRMTVELRDILIEAKDSSLGEFGGGPLGPFLINKLIEGIVRDR
jgi:hypothetical protein